jgi:vancomycin resistance protein VanW
MTTLNQVEKPKQRSDLRKFFGKEFFIIKRQIKWHFGDDNFSKVDSKTLLDYPIIKHRSFLLRPLKDVEMYLQHNKVTNLKIAITNIDNVVIKPGETFSIWRLVGRPTKSKGYLEGMTLHNGRISKDTGGGLCQLGNLIYWMALHSPLTIKERWRHSYDVFPDINRTIPFACGATLAYNYIDLQLQNNTDKTFQIKLWVDNEYLNGELLCNVDLKTKYEIYETDHMFQQQWWGGYTRHNRIWKRITNLNDNSINEELVTENNAIMMYSPLLDS